MKRVIILFLCAAMIGAAVYYYYRRYHTGMATIAGPPPRLMSQFHVDAPAVGYIDVATLRASAFFGQIAASLPAAEQDPEYAEFVRATGFDYTRDLDRAAVAAWPGSPAAPVVVLVEGRFDFDKIRQYALRSGTVSSRGDKQIYEVRVNGPAKTISFAFLAPNRLALASGKSLDAVLGPAPDVRADPAMRQRIQQVAGASLFGVARTDDLPKDLSLDISHSDQLGRLLRSVRYLTLVGRPEGERFGVVLDAECDSKTNAFQLASLLGGMRWVGRAALADPKTRRQLEPQTVTLLDNLLRALDVSHQDQRVELRVALTPEMLNAALKSPAAKPH